MENFAIVFNSVGFREKDYYLSEYESELISLDYETNVDD